MKLIHGIAIGMLVASIITGYLNNTLIAGDLIFRVILIVGNIVGYATWDEE